MTILDVETIPYFADFGLVGLKDYICKGIYEGKVAFARQEQTADLEVNKEFLAVTILQLFRHCLAQDKKTLTTGVGRLGCSCD